MSADSNVDAGHTGRTRSEQVLTPRLIQVLELAAQGYTVEDSAEEQGVGVHTIARQRCLINQALGADNVQHAIALAMERGIIGTSANGNGRTSTPHEVAGRLLMAEADRVQTQQVHKPLPVEHPERCVTILLEEIGEVAAAVQKRDADNLQHELIQVGAVVVQWLARLNHTPILNKEGTDRL